MRSGGIRNRLRLLAALPALLACVACARPGTLVTTTIRSRALEHNLLGDSPNRTLTVYLPGSYDADSDRRFPVLYLLHGYGTSHEFWTSLTGLEEALDGIDPKHAMIVVMPDARTRLLGGFYSNSPTSGNWQDFITQDLVTHVDTQFRTLADPKSRGIAGHSMGGYGAIRAAMMNPGVFGAVYAMSPCCLGLDNSLLLDPQVLGEVAGLKALEDLAPIIGRMSTVSGRRTESFVIANVALAAAWSPNTGRPPFFADFLAVKTARTVAVSAETRERWLTQMPLHMPDDRYRHLDRLQGLALDFGTDDEFEDIPANTRAFSAALKQRGISHEVEEYEGNHLNRILERITTRVLPFFVRTLPAE